MVDHTRRAAIAVISRAIRVTNRSLATTRVELRDLTLFDRPRVVCAVVSRSNSAGDLVAFMLERLAEPAVAR
jgi:hypothetical protein